MKLKQLHESRRDLKTVTGTLTYRPGHSTGPSYDEDNVSVTVDCSQGDPYEKGILGCKIISVNGGRMANQAISVGGEADYDVTDGTPAILDGENNLWAVADNRTLH